MNDTSFTPSGQYSLLRSELHRRAAACRQPVDGAFELTDRCNLACRMCYIRRSACRTGECDKELSSGEWLELARQAVDGGMVFLLLTGGEVFLRSDFFDVYTPLTKMGLVLGLFTNGTLITPTIAARLAEAPPSQMEITLYGATAATYEAITGVPGSFQRCCAAIESLLNYGVPLALKTTITRQNVDELDAMREMAHNWRVSFRAGWLLFGRRDRRASDAADCRLSTADGVELEAADSSSASEWKNGEASHGNERTFYCLAGKCSFVVNAQGEMSPCMYLSSPFARPLEMGFDAAWKQVQGFVDSAPPLDQDCIACEVRAYCQRCPAWSTVENGTLVEHVPYLCEIARARKERYARFA